MTRLLILTHGLPASGKSTWAEKRVRESDGAVVRVNRDDLRTEIAGASYHRGAPNQKIEGRVTQEQHKRIKAGLAQDKTVISDDTNLNPRFMRQLATIAHAYNAPVHNQYFDVPVDECKRRNRNRDRVVPDEILDRMAKDAYTYDGTQLKRWNISEGMVTEMRDPSHPDEQYLAAFNATLPGAAGIKGIEGRDGRKLGITFDFDGTLCDTRAISDLHMGRKKNFHAFHMSSLDAPTNEDVVRILHETRERGIGVIGLTARQSRYAQVTIDWVRKHCIELDALYMRSREDYRPDYTVKSEIIKDIENDGWDICHAVDDNPQVVRRWLELGVNITQVPWHNAVDVETAGVQVYEKQIVQSPFSSGGCIRCGKPLKTGFIGPKCRTKS